MKKVVKKSRVEGRPGVGKKLAFALLLVLVIGSAVFFAVYKPAKFAKVKETATGLSDDIKDIKQKTTTFIHDKLEPKPVITEPAQPPIEIAPEAAIVRPTDYNQVVGSWTGKLNSDKQGPDWTFTFNKKDFIVSIKNDSGLSIKGSAVYHWDQGMTGESLRAKARWNAIDIEITKSSVKGYEGKTAYGAFSRIEDDLKLCMSKPGTSVQLIETDAPGDIQCFKLKKAK